MLQFCWSCIEHLHKSYIRKVFDYVVPLTKKGGVFTLYFLDLSTMSDAAAGFFFWVQQISTPPIP